MKILKKLMKALAIVTLLVSCSESNRFISSDEGIDSAENALKSADKEIVILVEPDGTDDTQNLLDAFAEAMMYEPHATVQLASGNYYLNFMEVREFSGKFRGAGMGETVISTVEDLDVNTQISLNLNLNLIRFVGGNVSMSNMTLMVPPGPLSTGDMDFIYALAGFTSHTAQYTAQNEHINALVDQVEFVGSPYIYCGLIGESAFFGEVPGGIPLSNMDIIVTNCSFHDFDGTATWFGGAYGVYFDWIGQGSVLIGGTNNGNSFVNDYWGGIGTAGNVNVELTIKDNTFVMPVNMYFGIEINTYPYVELVQQILQTHATCTIENNTFNIIGGTGGIWMNDRRRAFYPDEPPLMMQVKNNKFNMDDAFTAMGCFNMFGEVIRNNTFNGTGQFGVRIMGQGGNPFNENGLMLGNNLSNADFVQASVILNARTSNWTIVGGNLGETVLNYNPSGNHVITGFNVNTSEYPLGQSLEDNLEALRKALKNPKNN